MGTILSLKVTNNGDQLSCYAKASEDDSVTVEYYVNDVITRVMSHHRDTPLIHIFEEINKTFAQIV